MTKVNTVEFLPGCFDNFEGTQEELDQLIAEITSLAESGKLLEMCEPLDLDFLEIQEPGITRTLQ